MPQEGKDEAYDEVDDEIQKLERHLDEALHELENETGYAQSNYASLYADRQLPIVLSYLTGIVRSGIK